MGKVEKSFKRYLVKVIIRPEGYNKVVLEGMFVPKRYTCHPNKIKKQCWEYLSSVIDFEKYGLNHKAVEKEIIVKAIPEDFIVAEV